MNRIRVQTHIRAHKNNRNNFAFNFSAVGRGIYTCPGVGWCRVAGLAETINNSVKLKLKLRLSLAIFIRDALKKLPIFGHCPKVGGGSEKSQTSY